MKKQPALSAAHCQVLQQPFYQFAQMKQFAPDSIEGVKAQYRSAWTDWRDFVLAVQAALAAQGIVFAAPHIERWCNGWQVRAHFFAFFKLPGFERDAPILSLILNRQRFTVSLDWHAYKAAQSHISLAQYHQWLDQIGQPQWAGWDLWRGKDSEYAEHKTVAAWQPARPPFATRRIGGTRHFGVGRGALDGFAAALPLELPKLNRVFFVTITPSDYFNTKAACTWLHSKLGLVCAICAPKNAAASCRLFP